MQQIKFVLFNPPLFNTLKKNFQAAWLKVNEKKDRKLNRTSLFIFFKTIEAIDFKFQHNSFDISNEWKISMVTSAIQVKIFSFFNQALIKLSI